MAGLLDDMLAKINVWVVYDMWKLDFDVPASVRFAACAWYPTMDGMKRAEGPNATVAAGDLEVLREHFRDRGYQLIDNLAEDAKPGIIEGWV